MRTWTRATALTVCGGLCRGLVAVGEPLLVVRLDGVKRVKHRCARCADEPVPADLPPLRDPAPITPMAHIRTGPNALPFDFKMAAAGRLPGEDD